MLKLTFIARVSDGLALAASMEDDSETKELEDYKRQRKKILQQLQTFQAPPEKLSIDSGPFNFHILTENGITYMTLCEKSFSTQLAYNFLSELKKEFYSLYGHEVNQVERPYAFIKFDTFIQKSKRVYSDTRTKRNLQKLKEELADVQSIVRKNIEDVVGRGAKLDQMSNMSNDLLSGAQKLKKNAVNLNKMYFWKTYGPVVVVLAIVFFLLIIKFYFW